MYSVGRQKVRNFGILES